MFLQQPVARHGEHLDWISLNSFPQMRALSGVPETYQLGFIMATYFSLNQKYFLNLQNKFLLP